MSLSLTQDPKDNTRVLVNGVSSTADEMKFAFTKDLVVDGSTATVISVSPKVTSLGPPDIPQAQPVVNVATYQNGKKIQGWAGRVQTTQFPTPHIGDVVTATGKLMYFKDGTALVASDQPLTPLHIVKVR
jgi:hypothetical protein